jgi:hypothetical protein
MRHFSTKTLLAATIAVALGVPAFAMGTGNIAGSEYSGEPINSSVRSSARNPVTGLTPGGEAAYGQAHKKIYLKKKKHLYPAGNPPVGMRGY